MANIQLGYGHGDVVGIPFDFYGGATLVTGSTITMQTGVLVVNPPGAISVTINLPLNPVDGADASISNVSASTLTLTAVNANTGDTISNLGLTSPTALTPAALATAGSASNTIRYKYTLNGFQPASGAAVTPRTWFRVQ
jgi:hypothetical protein